MDVQNKINMPSNAVPQWIVNYIRGFIKGRNQEPSDFIVHMWFVNDNGDPENVSAILVYLEKDKQFIWLHQWWHEEMGTLVRVEFETVDDAGRIIFEEG